MGVLEPWMLGILVGSFMLYKLSVFVKYRHTMAQLGCSPVSRYPHRDPFLGYDLHRRMARSRQLDQLTPTIQRLYSEYGRGKTFEALTWGVKTLHTINADNIKSILTADPGSFGVEAIRKAFNDPWIKGGVTMSDGPVWKTSRAMVKPFLSKSHFWDLSEFGKHVDRLLASVPKDGTTVDLQPLFFLFYLDVTTDLLLGESVESQTRCPRIDVPRFFASVDRALQGVQRRVALGGILRLVPRDRPYQQAVAEVHKFFDHYVDRALTERLSSPLHANHMSKIEEEENPKRRLSVLHELINESQDTLYVRDQLLSVFLPLHNATPIGISDLFFQVARSPEVFAKLRAEVLEVGDVALTFEVLKSMKYLQCVIKESLRLLAGLDRILRLCLQDCILPCGGGDAGEEPIFVQRGTLIETNTSILHRDPTFWGPDADLFRPERWLDGTLRPRWEYLPFSGGPRNCPAQQMALTHYAFIIARFAQTFETIECRDEVREFVSEYRFSKRSKNGVKVAFGRVIE